MGTIGGLRGSVLRRTDGSRDTTAEVDKRKNPIPSDPQFLERSV